MYQVNAIILLRKRSEELSLSAKEIEDAIQEMKIILEPRGFEAYVSEISAFEITEEKKSKTKKEVELMQTDKFKIMEDISGAETVEVSVDNTGTVLWVNVDGKCVLRISKIEKLEIVDRR